jgi:hypothetical protein
LGILGGTNLLWLQLMAIFMGVVMLSVDLGELSIVRLLVPVWKYAEAKAQSLCAESQASEMVGKALTESKEKVDAKDADIPYPCKAALEDLAKIDSEWAKAKQKEVINACYVDLGKVIMEVKVPDMKYVCDFRVKEVYQAVAEHGLDDADLLAWVEKAKPLCEKD